jgi:hypothetical protein
MQNCGVCGQEIFEDNEKLILDGELCHWGCAWEEIIKLEVNNEQARDD